MTCCNANRTSSTSMCLTQAMAAHPFVLLQGAQATECVTVSALELFGRHRLIRCRPAVRTTVGALKHAATCPATESIVTTAEALANVATNCCHESRPVRSLTRIFSL